MLIPPPTRQFGAIPKLPLFYHRREGNLRGGDGPEITLERRRRHAQTSFRVLRKTHCGKSTFQRGFFEMTLKGWSIEQCRIHRHSSNYKSTSSTFFATASPKSYETECEQYLGFFLVNTRIVELRSSVWQSSSPLLLARQSTSTHPENGGYRQSSDRENLGPTAVFPPLSPISDRAQRRLTLRRRLVD